MKTLRFCEANNLLEMKQWSWNFIHFNSYRLCPRHPSRFWGESSEHSRQNPILMEPFQCRGDR